MKRIVLTSFCLLMAALSFAQGPQGPQAPGQAPAPDKKWAEKIQAEKIAFITTELDLTPEEAQVFWPVYNKYWKENMAAHDATMKAFWALRVEDGVSDKEISARVDAYVAAYTAEQNLFEGYYAAVKKVLPIEKVARLIMAEDNFRMKMIRGLRDGGLRDGGQRDGGRPGEKPDSAPRR